MSSAEEDNIQDGDSPHTQGSSKKRRVQRACDVCRRKKIRCDGGQMPNNRCSNCIAYNAECTYVEAAKKRGPPKGYVEGLERRLEQMERMLKSLHPDKDFSEQLGNNGLADVWYGAERSGSASSPVQLPEGSGYTRGCRGSSAERSVPTGLPLPLTEEPEIDSSDDERIVFTMHQLSLDPIERRFIGKSSGMNLVQAAIDLKREYAGEEPRDIAVEMTTGMHNRRAEFWSVHPWELVKPEARVVRYNFPAPDLLPILIDYYFTHVNMYFPLLHRPTFEQSLAQGLQHTNRGFADTLLLVCALGARWTDDPRVLLKNTSHHSAGWKYFDQIEVVRNSLMMAPTLYDLQIFALSSLFLQGSSAPQASWTVTGIGVRLAQDIGAHRKKMYNSQSTEQGELFKRAFWILLCFDRLGSASLGRPCGMHDEDFDCELPLEVDDEYWNHPDPEQAFKQPAGIPSKLTYFLSFLKLNQILAFALRTIYSINKSKVLLGFVGPQWQQHIVAELDSALNKWVDNVPDHLRWNPNREDILFFNQSAALYAAYYHTQILVHRPFIPSPRKPSPLSFPSLAICTNAARSCSHVVDVQRRREQYPISYAQIAAFTSGIVLLMNIWGAKRRSVISAEPGSQLSDVHKCMQALKALESRWYSAGRLWDILNELASSVTDAPSEPRSTTKRSWDENGNDESVSSSSTPPSDPGSSRPIASNRRVAGACAMPDFNTLMQPSAFASSAHLPMNSAELGRAYMQMDVVQSPAEARLLTDPALWPEQAHQRQRREQQQQQQSHDRGQVGSSDTPSPPQHQAWSAISDIIGRPPNNNVFGAEHAFYPPIGEEFSHLAYPVVPPPMAPNVASMTPNGNIQGHPQQQLSAAAAMGMFGPQGLGVGTAEAMNPAMMTDLVDSDTLAMWSTATGGFELEDWASYVHNPHVTVDDEIRMQPAHQHGGNAS